MESRKLEYRYTYRQISRDNRSDGEKKSEHHASSRDEVDRPKEQKVGLNKTGHKLWYVGKYQNRNGVGIVFHESIVDDVVEVQRYEDRVIRIKVVMGKDVLHVNSAYAPQVDLAHNVKQEFWDRMDDIMQTIPIMEKVIIEGDLNRHVGMSRDGYEEAHGGYGYGSRNREGESILDYAWAYDMVQPNACFQK
ncbi:uncharacterized protein [Rutidosis leptorrhynchoides]|uniref:uncharacterized protein n=1 Tax=Rutidosis leptorrhynchoides TaxID=125765 RepID=UPI003A98E166